MDRQIYGGRTRCNVCMPWYWMPVPISSRRWEMSYYTWRNGSLSTLYLSSLPWIIPGALSKVNGVPGNIKGKYQVAKMTNFHDIITRFPDPEGTMLNSNWGLWPWVFSGSEYPNRAPAPKNAHVHSRWGIWLHLPSLIDLAIPMDKITGAPCAKYIHVHSYWSLWPWVIPWW